MPSRNSQNKALRWASMQMQLRGLSPFVEASQGRTIILATSQSRNDVYAVAEAINALLDSKAYLYLTETAVQHHSLPTVLTRTLWGSG